MIEQYVRESYCLVLCHHTVGSRDTAVLPLSIVPGEFHQLPGQMREREIQKANKGSEKLNKIMWT